MKNGLRKTGVLIFTMILASIYVFAQKENVKIEAYFKNNISNEISQYTLEDIISQQALSAGNIANNSMTIALELDEPGFYRLAFSQNLYLLLAIHPGLEMKIVVDMENFLEPVITGSKENADFYKEIAAISVVSVIEDSIEFVFNSNYGVNDTLAAQAVMQYQLLEMQKRLSMQNFIKNNPGYLVSLYFIEQLSIEEDYDIFKLLVDSLTQKYPNNEFVINLKTRVEKESRLAVGSIAPDIKLLNPDGKEVALSSLRGKYVLIDFWAAWCGPCRRESPNLVSLYEKYNQRGFEIFSVSLDQSREAWLKAIEDDNLSKWTHVSDLKYWQSEAAKDYGVEGIPFTVLLDKEGRIIAKRLRGQDLLDKMSELLD